MFLRLWTAIIILFFSISLQAKDGLIVEMESKTNDNSGMQQSKLYMTNDMLAMDQFENNKKIHSMIFKSKAETAWIINHDDGEYMLLDKDKVEKLNKQMQSVYSQMEKQLENMPPEQREMMEKMMKERGLGAMGTDTDIEYMEQGKESYNGYSTTVYNVIKNGEMTQKIWAADYSEIDITKSDVQVFYDFFDFMKSLFNQFKRMNINFTFENEINRINGFPVKTQHYDGKKVIRETVLKRFEQGNINDSKFQVPEDYELKEFNLER